MYAGLGRQIPEGLAGSWRVARFDVSEDAEKFGRLRAMISASSRGRYVPAGQYTGLYRGRALIMSDTPDEMSDHREFLDAAKSGARVLINGLGLGMCVHALLEVTPTIEIDVVEKSSDVIALVGPAFPEPNVSIIQADAFEYRPPRGAIYDAVWHDIWDNICGDNLTEMARLHRRYGRRSRWQGSWRHDRCKRAA